MGKARKVQKKGNQMQRDSARHTDEMLKNLQTVREFAREEIETDEFEFTEFSSAKNSVIQHLLGHGQWMVFVVIARGGHSINAYFASGLVNKGLMKPAALMQVCNL